LKKPKLRLLFFLLAFAALPVFSGEINSEIEHLLTSVGKSNCTFIRNGKEHASNDAEEHLRMKYRKGKNWVANADQFIERIATKSSLSRAPYYIRCSKSEHRTGEWLSKILAEYRYSKAQ